MVYLITSSHLVLYAEVRAQESQVGDPSIKASLKLTLKKTLSEESYLEQQECLNVSAIAAFMSFNKLDQRRRYRAGVNLIEGHNRQFNFNQGSTSSGLGYALALFESWWSAVLKKPERFRLPVFATGEILTSGHVRPISYLSTKIKNVCMYVEQLEKPIDGFYICYPKQNDDEVSPQLRQKVSDLGGILTPVSRLQDLLLELLGESYDGDPLGRWAPFKGLQSFDYEDNLRFFGRDTEVERLYRDFKQNSGLLIVSGSSGAGKSSLVKAGLIPRLVQDNKELFWSQATPSSLAPGKDILDYVLMQIDAAWGLQQKGVDLSALYSTLLHEFDNGITQIYQAFTGTERDCIVYFDQFEEVFSQYGEDIHHILLVLDRLANRLNTLNIVLTIRSEYLGRFLDNSELKSPIITNIHSQLGNDDWHAIIHDQATFSGITFEHIENLEPLDKVIINEAITTPYALPMVEFLLEQLYLKATKSNPNASMLLFEHYRELGGLKGAIAHRASRALRENQANSALIARFFDKFVGFNGESLPFAKHVDYVALEQEEPVLFALVSRFIDANLIISNQTNSSITLKLVHDSLFESWQELRHWITNNNDYLTWRYIIDGQFKRWQQSDKNHAFLLTDTRLLKEGKTYHSKNKVVDPLVKQFLNLSEKNKIHIRLRLLTVTVLLPLLVLSLYVWDQTRIKSVYYSTIGEKWGVPFGVNEIQGEQKLHLGKYYRFDFRGGILEALNYQNSRGVLVSDKQREGASRWEYSYTSSGDIHTVSVKDPANNIVRVDSYTFEENDRALVKLGFKRGDNPSALRLRTLAAGTYSDIDYHRLFFNENGYIIRRQFLNAFGKKQASDGERTYGFTYTYDVNGLKRTKTFVGIDDRPIQNQFSEVEFNYDPLGNVTKHYYRFNQTDTRFLVASEVNEYDSWGNIKTKKYKNSNGDLVIGPQNFAIAKYDYDKHGNPVEISYFDTQHSLVVSTLGYAKIISAFDDNGRVIKESYFNSTEKPAYIEHGLAKGVTSQRAEYDTTGNITDIQYLDSDGNPTTILNGFSKVKIIRDEYGSISEERFFNSFGELVMVDGKYSILRFRYNKLGQQIEVAAFDNHQRPALMDGYAHRVEFDFDEAGNGTGYALYGVSGEPAVNDEGIWKIQYKFDEYNRPIKTTSFNPDGSRRRIYRNDGNGNTVEVIQFDEKGIRVNEDNYKVSRITHRYDKHGNMIETAYFDTDDRPVESVFGFAKEVHEYDASGVYIRRRLTYDALGKLADPITTIEAKSGTPDDFYSENPRHKTEFDIELNKARGGDPESFFRVAWHYMFGMGVRQDIETGRHWYLKFIESEQNQSTVAAAMMSMGDSYYLGLDGIVDYENALIWYEKAANLGVPAAIQRLGRFYLRGYGKPVNKELGIELLQEAAQLGDEQAKKLLIDL